MKVALLFFLLVSVSAVDSASVRAQSSTQSSTQHYAVDNTGWNGLSIAKRVAAGLGIDMVQRKQIDWSEISSDDLLFVLYPSHKLDQDALIHFVEHGGRVLLADDIGMASQTLAAFGLIRVTGEGIRASEYYRGREFAPFALPLSPDHPIAADVDKLLCNHPSAFSKPMSATPIFGFRNDNVVVAAARRQNGRLVASADPSLFINRMLEFHGNFQLFINVLRYLRTGMRTNNTTRLFVLSGNFALTGLPAQLSDTRQRQGGDVASQVNDILDEANGYLLTSPGAKAIAVLASFAMLAMLLSFMPARRRTKIDGSWAIVGEGTVSDGPAAQPGALPDYVDKSPEDADYRLPCFLLRQRADSALSHALGREISPQWTAHELRDSLAGTVQANLADLIAHSLYPAIRQAPAIARAHNDFSRNQISRREFFALQLAVDELCKCLETAQR